MRGSEFTFDSVDILYYNLNKISLVRGRTYIDTPKCIKNKKAAINPKNNDGKCFLYAMTAALNYKQIKSHPERISNIKPFINQYNWKEIDFPSHKNNGKKFVSNNKTIVLNILLVPYNSEKIRPAYISKHNLKHKNQVILLKITDGKKWHDLAVKKLSALFKGITSNHVGDFYCLNCFHSFRTKKRLIKHKNVCENHDYCYTEIPKENNKILKYNYGGKSMKVSFTIYTDLESLLNKIDTCHNNPKKSSTTKISKHKPSGYSLFTHCSFDAAKRM